MRFLNAFALAILLAFRLAFADVLPVAQPVSRYSEKELAQGHRERTLIVQPASTQKADSVEQDELNRGVTTARRFSHLNGMRLIQVPEGSSIEEVRQTLIRSGKYAVVATDDIRAISNTTPTDTFFNQQWSLYNNGASGNKAGADIGARAAWDTATDASTVIVAIVDSGINVLHPDIAANLWTNPDETNNDGIDNDHNGYVDDMHGIDTTVTAGTVASSNPTDENGHGTHVAGIIGAIGNNAKGISGVAWHVQIMPLKFIDSTGKGSTSDAITCINYAIAKKANIINASYGSEQGQAYYNDAEYLAINAARKAGIIFVAAAGNDTLNLDIDKSYPTSYPLDNIVSVGSTSSLDDPSTFSNYGSGACDLFAPGESIVSLNYKYTSESDGYVLMSGTSMAAPHVTGALALMKAVFPTDSYRGLINRLLRSTTTLGSLKGYCETSGRLNLATAIVSTVNRPFNDDFATRAPLSGSTLSVRSCNTLGTTEAGEPAHAGSTGYASLWYDWTPTSSSQVTIDTIGSEMDTLLAVYTGDSLASLVSVAANDNLSSNSLSSRVSFAAVAGTSYKIAVASKANTTGLILLNVGGVPANDSFATPSKLTGLSPVVTDLNTAASAESGDPSVQGYNGSRSMWYSWTAPASGAFQLSVTTSSFVPTVGVYTGASLGALTKVADAVGSSANQGVICSFSAVSGTTYLFCVNSTAASDTGQYVLSLTDSLWQVVTGGSVTNSPSVGSDGTVYVVDSVDSVYAISPAGSVLWKYTMTNGQDSSGVAVDANGNIYIPNLAGHVISLTSKSVVRWDVNLGTAIHNCPALSSDGIVVVKDDGGVVHGLNASSGAQVWSYTTGTDTYGGPSISSSGIVYIGDGSNVMHALKATDGTKQWTFTADGAIYTSPAIDNAGNLYFSTTSGTVYSLKSDGTQRWMTAGSASITSSPALGADGTVYLGGYDNKLHALNGTTGVERWTYTLGGQVRASSPALDDAGNIYVGCYDKLLYAVKSDGTLLRTYASADILRSSPVIFGTRLYIGCNDGKLYAYELGHGQGLSDCPMKGFNPARTGRYEPGAPAITANLESIPAMLGYSYTLSVTATGANLTYTWYKDGVKVSGASSNSLTINPVTSATAGSYYVVVANGLGSVQSATAVVTVRTPIPGRITNMSVRAVSEGSSTPLVVGFSIDGGSAKKPVLIRGAGASLVAFGLADAISNPELQLYTQASLLEGSNLDWGMTDTLSTMMQTVGAFLPYAAKDSALLASLSGIHTAWVFDEANASGVTMAEVYDADMTSGALPASGRLTNISARAMVRSGNKIIIAGFVISGNVPHQYLIRAVGPSLAAYGVPNTLAKPHLDLYKGGTIIQSNEGWGGNAAIKAAAAKVGAFDLASDTSLDSAMLVTLEPVDGGYTAQVLSADSSTGVALVEVYQVPE
jgi:subtilisin family serine protease/outer membrane protein assembly factor BamB